MYLLRYSYLLQRSAAKSLRVPLSKLVVDVIEYGEFWRDGVGNTARIPIRFAKWKKMRSQNP